MLLTIDSDGLVYIENSTNKTGNGLKLEISTVCTGEYTDYSLVIPGNAEVWRGKKKLKNTGKPFIIRLWGE